ncbi:RagB/SusD family nutrient uptake outer membrane protein [Leeuwenhoekiella parthenopeia]|uniref:RagB/SusD family nutrient uptake outer membrane protein n=1 Tax=Leeuwenhoekiella parthenopeia TaxID=2890320 RepID=A0ABS8GS77_9FLAO|nr:RagB/SusD family nutrient uptake outer membrane protein [Leeuwenhoekiella parthenopeia]MCC4212849.1 RagB/SusD family nutrient uptake outer membrane protein [Leeuwenhoekiella parthenopeia]
MKNFIKNSIRLTVLAVLCVGCSDDFLVEEPTGSVINADQLGDAIALNPELGEATMTGIYATMFDTGSGGTTGHDDYGHKGYDVFADMLCGDMALSLSTFGWYRSSITEFQGTQDFTFLDNYQVWRYYYRIVNLSNLVIESLGGNDVVPESADEGYVYGQALAMRAHSYFYLTQYMINDVEASWTQPTLPLYTEPLISGKEKSTTEEVYIQMENDLNRAIDLLDGYERPAGSKLQVDKPIAQTILAYVLGSRRDRWNDVVTLTNEALAGTNASLMDNSRTANGVLGGFNDVSSQGWMWGVDINAEIGLGLISWWGQIDTFSYSYAAYGDYKAMDAALYSSMPADDIRRTQFLSNQSSGRYLQPINKFYDSDRVVTGTSQIVKADYWYMRYAEVLLLNAEAKARAGQTGPARTALKTLVAARVTDPSFVDGLSGQALIDEIYKQTRLELWGEGKSYLAMKRNEATVTRGSNHLSFVGVPIRFDDERMSFEIPQQEIQDNNFIDSQN